MEPRRGVSEGVGIQLPGGICVSQAHFIIFSEYNQWNRDAESVKAWVYNFLGASVFHKHILLISANIISGTETQSQWRPGHTTSCPAKFTWFTGTTSTPRCWWVRLRGSSIFMPLGADIVRRSNQSLKELLRYGYSFYVTCAPTFSENCTVTRSSYEYRYFFS